MKVPPTAHLAKSREDRHISRPRHWIVAFVAATAATIAFGVPLLTALTAGKAPYERIHTGFPGIEVALATTGVQVLADAAGVVSIGALVTLLFLATQRGSSAAPTDTIEFRTLRISAGVWSLSSAVMCVLELFDANGVSPALLIESVASTEGMSGGGAAIAFLFDANQHPQAWAVTFVAASTVAAIGHLMGSWTSLLFALWAAMIGVVAPVVIGQILVGPNHDFGSDAGLIQTIAMTVVLGIIAMGSIRVASGRGLRAETTPRLFFIVGAGTSVVVAADVVLAVFKLQGPTAVESATAFQIAARFIAIIAMITVLIIAARQWRTGLVTHARIVRLLSASALAASWWLGWSIAMTRIPPPQYFVPTSISQNFLGFDVPDAPELEVLLTQWRPNVLFATLAVTGVVVYLIAVRTLRSRGDHWPTGRTVAWILGWAVVVIATSSGMGKYSGPDLGVHMVVHMGLNMLAPLLLVLGGVITLTLRATTSMRAKPPGIHDWITRILHWRVLHVLNHPLFVFVLFVGSYYALYLTGLFEQMVRYHWAHQLMNLHFLIVGYMYYGLAIGVDRPPRPLPHVGKLGFVLAAMPFHAFFGVILMTSTTLVAENFYLYLRLPWMDLPGAQYLAGGVAWAGGEIPLMIVVVVLGIQWARQDERQGKRVDRHLDTGMDDEFDEYNRMLARLTARKGSSGEHSHPQLVNTEGPAHDQH